MQFRVFNTFNKERRGVVKLKFISRTESYPDLLNPPSPGMRRWRVINLLEGQEITITIDPIVDDYLTVFYFPPYQNLDISQNGDSWIIKYLRPSDRREERNLGSSGSSGNVLIGDDNQLSRISNLFKKTKRYKGTIINRK